MFGVTEINNDKPEKSQPSWFK